MTRAERLYTVILAPVISEKSTDVGEKYHTAVFRVAPDASKEEIRAAVEKLFEVKVSKVGIVRRRGKTVQLRTRRGLGRRASSKKAYVHLQKGYDINFAELQ